MKRTIQLNDSTYYLNGAKPTDEAYVKFFERKNPTEDVDYFLAKRKINFFHPRHLHNGYDDLGWINSFLHDIQQPTEERVRRAMIFSIEDNLGEGPENKLAYKAGGGSCSDSVFVSSYSILIASPTTGEDTWVVLMKKYSTKFTDVIITTEEIHALFNQVATPEQIHERDLDTARCWVARVLRGEEYGWVPGPKFTNITYTPEMAENFFTQTVARFPMNIWDQALNWFDMKYKQQLTAEFEENQPGRNITAEHRAAYTKRLKLLARIRQGIESRTVPVTRSLAEEQLSLFAA